MKGLELNRAFFEEIRPELQRDFPELYAELAAGLVGNGSECFGYDDAISRDHDWGVALQLWLPEEERGSIPALQAWLCEAMERRPGYPYPQATRYCAQRGVSTVGDFYRSLTGCAEGPHTIPEWDRAPQENLALAVNGEVFYDGDGSFTRIREHILAFYPEDYRLKKLAARCAAVAQTGQYNYSRCLKRGDAVTAQITESRFLIEVSGLVFLLNRCFMPYYKWQHRRLGELPILGARIAAEQEALVRLSDPAEKAEKMEAICRLLTQELRREGLTESEDDFLLIHAEQIQSRIRDEQLRALPVTYG